MNWKCAKTPLTCLGICRMLSITSTGSVVLRLNGGWGGQGACPVYSVRLVCGAADAWRAASFLRDVAHPWALNEKSCQRWGLHWPIKTFPAAWPAARLFVVSGFRVRTSGSCQRRVTLMAVFTDAARLQLVLKLCWFVDPVHAFTCNGLELF